MNGNESSRAEAPGTFNSLHSRESENAGNISSYFSIAICGESAASSEELEPYFPDPRTEEQREKLTFALSSSTMKWQREALKKYSLALYFSSGLSIVLAPTWRPILSNFIKGKHKQTDQK